MNSSYLCSYGRGITIVTIITSTFGYLHVPTMNWDIYIYAVMAMYLYIIEN